MTTCSSYSAPIPPVRNTVVDSAVPTSGSVSWTPGVATRRPVARSTIMSAIASQNVRNSARVAVRPSARVSPRSATIARPGGAIRITRPVGSISTCRPPTAIAEDDRCLPTRNTAAFEVPPPMSTVVTCW